MNTLAILHLYFRAPNPAAGLPGCARLSTVLGEPKNQNFTQRRKIFRRLSGVPDTA